MLNVFHEYDNYYKTKEYKSYKDIAKEKVEELEDKTKDFVISFPCSLKFSSNKNMNIYVNSYGVTLDFNDYCLNGFIIVHTSCSIKNVKCFGIKCDKNIDIDIENVKLIPMTLQKLCYMSLSPKEKENVREMLPYCEWFKDMQGNDILI